MKLREKNIKKAIKKACVQHVPSTVKVGSLLFVHYARDTTASSINSHCPIRLLLQGKGRRKRERERERERREGGGEEEEEQQQPQIQYDLHKL